MPHDILTVIALLSAVTASASNLTAAIPKKRVLRTSRSSLDLLAPKEPAQSDDFARRQRSLVASSTADGDLLEDGDSWGGLAKLTADDAMR